jgi:hypothetical protein
MKAIITVMLGLFPMVTWAQGATDWLEITDVWSYRTGDKRVFVAPNRNDPDSCGNTHTLHIAAQSDESMYATVLMAFSTGKKVQFFMSGCATFSGHQTTEISRVAVKK